MPFEKGQSGNPGGRPKEEKEVLALAREKSVRAITRLAEWVEHDSPRASIPASIAILERAFGKPTQPIAGDPEGAPLGWEATIDVSGLNPEQLRALASIKVRAG
jgi:hypothetical protein